MPEQLVRGRACAVNVCTVSTDPLRSTDPAAAASVAMLQSEWKSTLTAASLDDDDFREKLNQFMSDANMLHLSHREMKSSYGVVVAAVIVLQRRIKEWVTERKRYKDSNKVLYRDAWGYAEQKAPDVARATARLRLKRVNEHGWRAPLNRRYETLGDVKTQIGRKPVNAAPSDEDERRRALSEPLVLNLNETRHGLVHKFEHTYFCVQHTDVRAHLVIEVEATGHGDTRASLDPDIFVSRTDKIPLPTLTHYTWKSSGLGDDRVEISTKDPEFGVGLYSIAVYGGGGGGGGNECRFAVRAHAYRPVGRGESVTGPYSHVDKTLYEVRFASERRQSDSRRQRAMCGQDAGHLMAERVERGERGNDTNSNVGLTPARRLLRLEEAVLPLAAPIIDYWLHPPAMRKMLRIPGRSPEMRIAGSSAAPHAAPAASDVQLSQRQSHRQLADSFLNAVRPKLAFALERPMTELISRAAGHSLSKRSQRPATPTGQSSGGAKKYEPRGLLQVGMNEDWVAAVVARAAVPISLPPGCRLFNEGDPCVFVAFVITGELEQETPSGAHACMHADTPAHAAPAAAPTPGPAPVAAHAADRGEGEGEALTGEGEDEDEATTAASAAAAFLAAREPLTHFHAGHVIGDRGLLGRERLARKASVRVCGSGPATLLLLPLPTLKLLSNIEPEGFEAIVRLLAAASSSMPHLSVAADDWAGLVRAHSPRSPLSRKGSAPHHDSRSASPTGSQWSHQGGKSPREVSCHVARSLGAHARARFRTAQAVLLHTAATMEQQVADFDVTTLEPEEAPVPTADEAVAEPGESVRSGRAGAPAAATVVSLEGTLASAVMGTLSSASPVALARRASVGLGLAPAAAQPSASSNLLPGPLTRASSAMGTFRGAPALGRSRSAVMSMSHPTGPTPITAPMSRGMSSVSMALLSGGSASMALLSGGSGGSGVGAVVNGVIQDTVCVMRASPKTPIVMNVGMGAARPPGSIVDFEPRRPTTAPELAMSASAPMLGEYRLPSTATLKLLPAGAGSALRSSGTALEFFRRRDADAARRESQLQRPQRRFEPRAPNTALRAPGPLRFGALATPGSLEVLLPHEALADPATAMPAQLLRQATQTPEAIKAAKAAYAAKAAQAAARNSAALGLRAAQEEYYSILADTAIAVDIAMTRPGPMALITRARLQREHEEQVRERLHRERQATSSQALADAAAEEELERREGRSTRRSASMTSLKTRPSGLFVVSPQGTPSGRRSPGGERPITPNSLGRSTPTHASDDSPHSVHHSASPRSPGLESIVTIPASASANTHASAADPARSTRRSTRPRVAKLKPAEEPKGHGQAGRVKQRVALAASAFVHSRREAGQGLREELNRAADERMEAYQCKMMALDVERLVQQTSVLDPKKEMRKVRERAFALAKQRAQALV